MVKIAILGAGYMGQNHARILSSFPNVKVVAICDVDARKAGKIGKQYKLKQYNDFNLLLKSEDLDAISICLPTTLHFKAAVQAINKRITIFLEKPICAKAKEAKKLVKLAKDKKVQIMVGHIERFNPVVNEIKQRIKSGELGKLLKVQTQRFSPPPLRISDVSAAIDLATHDLDVINYILEEEPLRMYSESGNSYHKNGDIMSSLIRFPSGIIGVVEVSWLHPKKTRNLVVVGENGMYFANYITQELFFYRQNEKLFETDTFTVPGTTNADVVKIVFKAKEPLRLEMEAFINALRNNLEMPVTAVQGLAALQIAEQLVYSGDKHRVVK